MKEKKILMLARTMENLVTIGVTSKAQNYNFILTMNSWSLVIFMSCNLLNTLWNCNPPLVSHIAPVSCSKGTFYASFHQRLASWYYRVTTEWCDTTLEYHGSKDPTQSLHPVPNNISMKETAREIQEFLYLLDTWKVQQDRESFMDLRHRFPSLGFPNTFFMRNIYWTNHSLLQSLLLTAYLLCWHYASQNLIF